MTRNQWKRSFKAMTATTKECDQCDGIGIIQCGFLTLDVKHPVCRNCDGTGRVPIKQELQP